MRGPVRSVDGKPVRMKDPVGEQRLFLRRALVALAVVLLALLTLVGRLAYLQVVNHEHFSMLAESNRIKLQPLPPTRGLIYDRNGVLLAENLSSQYLEITPDEVENLDTTLTAIRERLALSELDVDHFRRLIRRSPPYQGLPLRFNLSDEEVARLAVDLHRLPGVAIKAALTRHYPLGARAAHVLGYVARIDEAEMQRIDPQQYQGITHIGKIGVERSYEDLLRGQAGVQQVETNAQGRPLRLLRETSPVPGKHIFLSIDMRLQQVAEQALTGHNGAVVAIDPRNGEILAMASMPVYDPNLFVNGIEPDTFKALNTSPDRPLYNRALRGIYPPGSTIKPFVALASLDGGVVNRNQTVHCGGAFSLPGQSHRFRCWKRSGHGGVNLDRAISQSCDVYFYTMAVRLGIERLHDYLLKFDLGRPTGVDLVNEKSGLVPSEAWKKRTRNQPWYGGDTVTAGIGQGFMLATPLQLAHATATLSQRGQGFRPRLLHATQDQSGGAPVAEPPRPLPPILVKDGRNWEAVITGMVHVVQGGTARRIGVNATYTIAGKTGTSQVFSLGKNQRYDPRRLPKHLKDHALFIAFAPAEDPRIAVAVIAEHGGGGSATAAPIARQVLDAWLVGKP